MRNRSTTLLLRLAIVALPVVILLSLLWALGVHAQPAARPASAQTWTTGGPYGGEVRDLVVNPLNPDVAYALLHNAGLYMTDDGGASWRPSMIDPWPQGVTLDAVDPDLMYFAGQQHLYRSPDGGESWERIGALSHPSPHLFPITHPVSPGVLYLGVGVPVNRPLMGDEITGVFRWDDATDEWSDMSTGITDTLITSLAFLPDDPSTMAASTRSGNVFLTEDGGNTWEWRAKVASYIYRLAFNPFTPGEVWALTKDPTVWAEPPTIFRSTDASLTDWEPLTFPGDIAPVLARSVTFVDGDPGVAYLASHGEPALVSTDGGDSWQVMAGSPPAPTCFGAVGDGLRYIGTLQRGAYASADGGTSWEASSVGLAGVLPESMVAVPGAPAIAFAQTESLGLLRTADGGQTWEEIAGVRREGFPWRDSVLAAQGGPEGRVYLGSQCEGLPCLKVGDLDGASWETHLVPMPPELEADTRADVFAVYADPTRPGRVLAGITFFPPNVDLGQPKRVLGAISSSDDYGATWETAYGITATLPISGVIEFASSPAAPEVIWAATDGTGLLRTTDGGDTWEPVAGWAGPAFVRSVAVDRHSPQTVYVAATESVPGELAGVYVSYDGGETWERMEGTGGDAWVLHMAASEPPVLYLGTWGGGVRRLEPDGQWSNLTAVPERSNVFSIASGRDEDHAIVYVALSGDNGTPPEQLAVGGAVLLASEARSGGIYQLSVPDQQAVYLPLSVRQFAPQGNGGPWGVVPHGPRGHRALWAPRRAACCAIAAIRPTQPIHRNEEAVVPDRPNVLVIMTDQQSHAAMRCAGNDDLATPAMDDLAAAGVRFSNSYCKYPLCTPSRASMFTGEWPHAIGAMGNGRPIPEPVQARELGALFAGAGYDCVYGGKWHVPEIAMPDGRHGFRTICGFDDTHLADRCIDYLRARHNRPFLMVASFDNPHNICEWARGQVLPWGPIEERPVACCPNLPLNHAATAFEAEAIRMEQAWSPRVYPVLHYSAEQWRRYRNAYLRLVEKVDAQVGRILEALRDAGLARDTLVVFTSDHGDGMGAHGWNQKSILYDEIVRVQLLLSWPGVIPQGRVDPRLVSTGLDLLPTLCDYAGIPTPEGLPGLSLRRAVEEPAGAPWRDQVCAETVLGQQIRMEGRMVRTARFKYVVYSYGLYREQLYDLERDPGEMVNLAVEERYRDVLAEHRRRLRDWCLETGDRFEEHTSHPGQPTVPGFEYV